MPSSYMLSRNIRLGGDQSTRFLTQAPLALFAARREGIRQTAALRRNIARTLATMIGTITRASIFMNKFRTLGFIKYHGFLDANGGLHINTSRLAKAFQIAFSSRPRRCPRAVCTPILARPRTTLLARSSVQPLAQSAGHASSSSQSLRFHPECRAPARLQPYPPPLPRAPLLFPGLPNDPRSGRYGVSGPAGHRATDGLPLKLFSSSTSTISVVRAYRKCSR
jgi:hypothetical protein